MSCGWRLRWVSLGAFLVGVWVQLAGVAQAQTPSADGGVVFVLGRFGSHRIFRAEPDGSGAVQLTFGPGEDGNPVFSPDARKVAFESTRTGGDDGYTMNADS